MVKRLQGRFSNLPSEEYQPGCMGSMFHLFGLQQLFRSPKRLSQWSQGEEGRGPAGSNYWKSKKSPKPNYCDYERLDVESDSTVGQESNPHGKTPFASYAEPHAERLYSNQEDRKKILPLSPHLTRTLSIHHLECNDYVVSDNVVPADADGGGVFNTHDVGSRKDENYRSHGVNKDHDDKGCGQIEALDSTTKHQNVESTYPKTDAHVAKARASLDAAESFDADVEKFFRITHNPDHLAANPVHDIGSSSSSSILTRRGSYPRAKQEGSGGDGGEFPTTRKHAVKPRGSTSVTENHDGLPFSFEHKVQNGRGSSQGRHKDVREKLRDVTSDSKKETLFITMDGILDKVPYGHKIHHDSSEPMSSFNRNRWRSKSVREHPAPDEKRSAIPRFSRSRSLTDSLEKFSNSLRSNSNVKHVAYGLERSKSTHGAQFSVGGRNPPPSIHGRIHSLPEFLADFPIQEESIEPFHITSSTTTEVTHLNGPFPPMETSLPGDRNAEQEREVEPSIDARNAGNEHASEVDVHLNRSAAAKYEDTNDGPPRDHRSHPPGGEEIGVKAQSSSGAEELSSQSVLGTEFGDILMSHDVNVIEGQLDLAPHEVVEAQGVDLTAAVEYTDEKFMSQQAYELEELRAQLDSNQEADYNYVMDVLVKTGFYGGGTQVQHSPQLPLSPLAFKELEGLSLHTEICTLDADIDLNHLLLFDLVNEILIEMRESSTIFSWRTSFVFHGRSLPTGPQCLRDVWGSVSRRLTGSSPDLDHLSSQDLARKDGWANPRFEVEDVTMEVEDMIVDDLLDQLLLCFLNPSSIE